MLYLGTENGIYVTYDGGDHWLPLQNNLPHAPVSGIVVQPQFNDLVISTYGRGFWILDDISALQQLTTDITTAPSHLFAPREAWRFRPITAPSTMYDDPTTGQDPEYGAVINYYLKAPAKSAPMLEVLDASGKVVRSWRGPNGAGLNRTNWDLRDTPSTEIRLLTSPLYADHIVTGAEGRAAPGGARISILMPPGTYTVKLTVDGAASTQPLVVRKDPNSSGTEAEIVAQVALLTGLKGQVESAVTAVHRLEAVRLQVQHLQQLTADGDVARLARAFDAKLVDAEMNLIDLRLTGGGQDGVRFGAKLISKINYLANGAATSDFKPTSQHVEVQQILVRELRQDLAAIDGLLAAELAPFNQQLKNRNLPEVVDRKPSPTRLVP
jgi:hypothetical protein